MDYSVCLAGGPKLLLRVSAKDVYISSSHTRSDTVLCVDARKLAFLQHPATAGLNAYAQLLEMTGHGDAYVNQIDHHFLPFDCNESGAGVQIFIAQMKPPHSRGGGD